MSWLTQTFLFSSGTGKRRVQQKHFKLSEPGKICLDAVAHTHFIKFFYPEKYAGVSEITDTTLYV